MDHHIFWELAPLYAGTDDPLLDRDLCQALENAKKLARLTPGELKEPQLLFEALKQYEEICERGLKPVLFGELKYSEDTRSEKNEALLLKVREQWEKIDSEARAFRVCLTQISRKDLLYLIRHPLLKAYRHYLRRCVEEIPHALSLQEERILAQKKPSGREALVRLYNDFLGSLDVPLEMNGHTRVLSVSQVLSFLNSAKREEALQSYTSLLKSFEGQGAIWSRILDALVHDNLVEARLRKYPSPIDAQHFINEIPPVVIKDMLDSVEEFYPLVRKYLNWKAQRLGVGHVAYTDIYVPLALHPPIDPSQAVETIVNAFERFHPQFGSIAREMFEQKRLHLAPMAHKKTGAFCGCLAPGQPAFVTMSFNGSIGDVLTLAHEVGHAIHYTMASSQSYLNFMPVSIVSETVSTLCEMIVVEYLADAGQWGLSPKEIFAGWIENIIKTVFRQNMITRFELGLHNVRKNMVLKGEDICELWTEENKKLYQDTVDFPSAFQWGWVHVPHIFERPFYCYSYVFGNLASILIYQKCKDHDCLENLLSFLCSGSSRAPLELFRGIGVQIDAPFIWRYALRYIDEKITRLEEP